MLEFLRERLETIPLFAGCNPSDLRVLAERCELRDVPAGTVLIRAGDMGDEFFVLLSGSVERGHGASARTLEAGAHFGELAVLDPAPRSMDVVALTASTVGVLSRQNFLLVLDSVPGVTPQLLAYLARQLRESNLDKD
jgi:CRP/FNR family transcriptional regulator, cyclic AMP receptor protein